jgi:transposase-like protein
MKKKDNVIEFKKPEQYTQDLLTEIAREGAKKMLAAAIEAEARSFIENHASLKTAEGLQRFVRNGYLPEREIQTGIGEIAVTTPRVRDRQPQEDGIKYRSMIIPPYLRRSKRIEEFLPLLYLKGISTGDFKEVLSALLGEEAHKASPGVISRLKSTWEDEYNTWQKRDLSLKRYVYWWVDGIYLQARMEDAKDCVLVVMGVTEQGNKELIAIEDGFRESKASWSALLTNIKARGLKIGPKVAVGDGALGFWAAVAEAYPKTRHQRCWCHKMINVLDKLPKSLQARAKKELQDIWMAPTRQEAYKAFDHFINTYKAKYPKASECLYKDKEELMTFYDFPAEHWKHLRTTNPIESTFSTVRHRTKRARGCFSRATILTMVFKLCQSAQEKWNRIHGFEQLAQVITGVQFKDGVAVESASSIGSKVCAA